MSKKDLFVEIMMLLVCIFCILSIFFDGKLKEIFLILEVLALLIEVITTKILKRKEVKKHDNN